MLVLLFTIPLPFSFSDEFYVKRNSNCETSRNKIIFISDTQQPIWLEKIFLKENRNLLARKIIFAKASQEKPTAIFHLGDIIAFGYANSYWRLVDKYLKYYDEEEICFYPIPGNHEYLLFPEKGEENFKKRFPFASVTGYSKRFGKTAVILLNSNFSKLTNDEINAQQKRYEEDLKSFDRDSSIKIVIVGTHYSPFTNSTIVSPSKEVQEKFLPPFYASKKAKVFLSGHAHAFEHFKMKGKDFLVIGGGGGLQQPLLTGKDERYRDVFDSTNSIRRFHLIKYTVKNDTAYFKLLMLKDNFRGFDSTYVVKVGI